MTWRDLLEKRRIERHETSREELADLRSAVERNLLDAAVPQLSADNRFGLAYEGALLLAKMAIACVGYRVKGRGMHHTTFVALGLALGEDLGQTANYLERCRRKRNRLSYDAAGIASDRDAVDLLARARILADAVEQWIADHHPELGIDRGSRKTSFP